MTEAMTPAKTATDTTLPLFYKEPILLRFADHAASGLTSHKGYDFARDTVAVPLGIGEFAAAIRDYPIVFSGDDKTPLAVVGIKQGTNLFVDVTGAWRAGAYVPAYLRRYPFIAAETPDGSARLLTVDAASDRFVIDAAERSDVDRLFDAAGEPTPSAQSAMDFCQAYHEDHLRTATFVTALAEAGLLSPKTADMRFPDGSRYLLDGFLAVDEEAYRALPPETLSDWHAKGWLDLVALHLASRQSWQVLLDLNAARLD